MGRLKNIFEKGAFQILYIHYIESSQVSELLILKYTLKQKALSIVTRIRILAVDLTVYIANLLDGCKVFHRLNTVGHHILALLTGIFEILEAFFHRFAVPFPSDGVQTFYLIDFQSIFYLNGFNGYFFS